MAISINDIKLEFSSCPIENIETLFEKYKDDDRKGVLKLIESYKNKLIAMEQEKQRIESLLRYEKELYAKGYKFIAGVDEVGRGPLAINL